MMGQNIRSKLLVDKLFPTIWYDELQLTIVQTLTSNNFIEFIVQLKWYILHFKENLHIAETSILEYKVLLYITLSRQQKEREKLW